MLKPLSVKELNTQIQSLIETTFIEVCVEGEVSNLTKHNSGHFYFSVKDETSAIRCVLFKGNALKVKFDIQNSQKIVVRGSISVYVPRGEYQIICKTIEPVGQGALHLAFEQLKNKFYTLGYFDASYKKPLPLFPKKIALITSGTGAALQDMLFVARKRWGLVKIVHFDTLVQGEGAKDSIVSQIQRADSYHGGEDAFDVIVIGRGGGSLEDLWAFNEEIVARTIFEAKTPIVSAVGHEVDYVISDFVADLRAPTPSAAMEMILPDKVSWLLRLDELGEELHTKLPRRFKNLEEKLREYGYFFENYNIEKKFKYNLEILIQLFEGLDSKIRSCIAQKNISVLREQIDFVMQNFLARKKYELERVRGELAARIEGVKKGYAQILLQGKIADLEMLQKGENIELVNEKGMVLAKVEQGFTKL
ncbi:exodeoxyribonuclease VII large subunit [Helicobacter sp. faydin-H20]|uniref:exodeoxyribonuclease VII large subunit n=1 Tax=Helicobacter anatolicus TaxID=2905874 RepID=UPI001E569EA6|nr:exodeoxyribonuclease VII large subunit [Helicobacter anatolicus]